MPLDLGTGSFLHGIKNSKPRIPGAEVEDVPPSWCVKEGQVVRQTTPPLEELPSSPNSPTLKYPVPKKLHPVHKLHPQPPKVHPPSMNGPPASEAFQLLVEKLIFQHVTELEAVRACVASGDESLTLDGVGVDSVDGKALMQRMLSPGNASVSSAGLSPALTYKGPWRFGRQSSASSSKVQVNASTILSAWERQDTSELHRDGSKPMETVRSEELSTGDHVPVRKERAAIFLESTAYEVLMSVALCANMLWMALAVQLRGMEAGHRIGFSYDVPDMETWRSVFLVGDAIFAATFIADAALRLAVLGCRFWKSWLNYVDVGVAIACCVELNWIASPSYSFMVEFGFIHLLRTAKLARALRMFSVAVGHAPLQLLVKCLEASKGMLFWSFSLLTLFQLLAGVVVSTSASSYLIDETADQESQEVVFRYYGTFTRTFLTMFEVMFANWGPACRVLVDHVNEWFSLFFLAYRCVFGFAVLNVVNSVFVQQTMKTANSDDELAFKQKEKDIAAYNRKVKKLFQTIDDSGDGAINLEEFEKLVQSPKLSFWMSQLELEYHDLLSLFEFLDNGDGQITLSEFIEGAARLRGNAKALDIWRMETKIEVLFEEVFKQMPPPAPQLTTPAGAGSPGELEFSPGSTPKRTTIQEVFNNSAFKHIRATSFRDIPDML